MSLIIASGINLFLGVLGVGIWWWKKDYFQKTSRWGLLVILFGILPVMNMFRPGTFQSGDLTFHAVFTTAYLQSIKDGHWLPRWSEHLNYDYGSAIFMFTYPLPYWTTAILHLLTAIPILLCVKIVIASAYILSGYFCYKWVGEFLTKKTALLAAIFYLFSPYHLVDLNFRVALGEIMAMMFLPLGLWMICKYQKTEKLLWGAVAGMAIAGMILSHQAGSLMAFPFIILYSFLIRKKSILTVYPLILGVALSAFYWLPAIWEGQFTHQDVYAQTVEFPKLWQFLWSPWGGGFLYQGHKGELAFLVGYFQWAAVAVAILLILKNKIQKKYRELLFLLLISFFGFFLLMQGATKPIWDNVALLRNMQFSYRILLIETLTTAVISGIVWENIFGKKEGVLFLGIIGVVILSSCLNWTTRSFLPNLTDVMLEESVPSNHLYNPYSMAATFWSDPRQPFPKYPWTSPIELLSGKGTVTQVERNSVKHEYLTDNKSEIWVRENTYYFPGWKLEIDGRSWPLNYTNPEFPGILNFRVPEGRHQLKVSFENTTDRNIGEIISLLGLGGLGISLIRSRNKHASYPATGVSM